MAGFNLRRNDHIPTVEESYNALFGVKLQGGITNIKMCDLRPYPDKRTFRSYSQEELIDLAEDIKAYGLHQPIIVRPIKDAAGYDAYQIIAGHNRTNACRLAGLDEISAIVKDVDDATAAIIFTTTNLNQRQKLLPSEKAFGYKLLMDSMRLKSGERTDLVSNGDKVDSNNQTDLVSNGDKVDTGKKIAELQKDSKANVFRYIRLTYLKPEFLQMVDEGELPFRAGVELSYLDMGAQQLLHEYTHNRKKKISLSHAEQIKEYCKKHSLTKEFLNNLFNPVKQKTTTSVKINMKKLADFIPSENINDAEDYILKALEFYKNHAL